MSTASTAAAPAPAIKPIHPTRRLYDSTEPMFFGDAILGQVSVHAERRRGSGEETSQYELSVRVPNLYRGQLFRWMSAPAVVDDFGDLVPVGDWS